MIELRGLHLGNIARSPAESVRPDLWPNHAFVPALGCTGGVLYDLCGGSHGNCIIDSSVGESSWAPLGLVGPCGGRVLPAGGASIFEGRELTVFTEIVVSSLSATVYAWSGVMNDYWENSMAVLATGACRWYTRDTSTGATGERNNDISTASGIVTINQSVSIAGTYSVSSGRKSIYVNGIEEATTTNSIDDLTVGQSAAWLWGNAYGPSISRIASTLVGDKHILAVFKRKLTSAKINDLTADPLLPFRRRQPVYYSVPSGGDPEPPVSNESPAAAMMMGI